VEVRTRPRRDHRLPLRFRDGGEWKELTGVTGPQRVSGGGWHDTPYAREYFRCVSEAGAILWLFRDARDGAWYLHGWWD
jgi:protein ImuB